MRRHALDWNARGRDAWVAMEAARLAPGSRVLDLGAGSCPYRPLFAHCRYLSQDATPLEPAQLAGGAYGDIDHRCDATGVPEPDGSFDAILCTEMLEHVVEPIAVAREMARLLRPGGTLLLTAPLGSGLHQEPYHFYGGYTPHWYRRVLGEVGFDTIEVTSNGGSFRHFAQWCVQMLLLARPRSLGGGLRGALASIIALPVLALLLVPAACVALLLDPLERHRAFTVGYFVRARRGDAPPPTSASRSGAASP